MENIGGRNFWSTKQIEVSGKEKFGESDKVNKYTKYNYVISFNVDEENLSKKLMIHQYFPREPIEQLLFCQGRLHVHTHACTDRQKYMDTIAMFIPWGL